MFLDSLYIHPRPTVLYQPRVAHSRTAAITTTQAASAPSHPSSPRLTKEAVVKAAIAAEYPVARPPNRFDLETQEFCPMYYPEDTYDEENVAEVLKLKQRLRARQALQSAAASGVSASRQPLERAPYSPSSSCSSSPASSPPSTPRMLPVDIPFPSQQCHESDMVKEAGLSRSHPSGDGVAKCIGEQSPSIAIALLCDAPQPIATLLFGCNGLALSASDGEYKHRRRHGLREEVGAAAPVQSVQESEGAIDDCYNRRQ
ncbi:hypothetical protein BV20DRAFT_1048330 [Pilatotrama ljubarskyi]|nr:hypothetical protein BV20DRAFT_1048330 [Pilatotrama ljubarskyi]